MRLNIVVGSTDGAYKYSEGRRPRRQYDYEKEDNNNNNNNVNNSNNINDNNQGGGRGGGGRRGGRGYDKRGNYNNKKTEENKKGENGEVTAPAPKRVLGYIPGAELEEDVPSTKTQINKQPPIISGSNPQPTTQNASQDSVTEIVSPSLPSPEADTLLPPNTEEEETVSHTGKDIPPKTNPQSSVSSQKQSDPSPNNTNNNPSQSTVKSGPGVISPPNPSSNDKVIQKNPKGALPAEPISPPINNSGKELLSNSHENGALKEELASSQGISQSYTFQLSTPLDAEITTGEQTFVEINGALYLKISPNSSPLPDWYTSLQEDFQNASKPKPSKSHHQKVKKNEVQTPELKNGKLIFPVKVPDSIAQTSETTNFKSNNKKPQQNVHNQKKKNNNNS